MIDKNGKPLVDGSTININQTVNGENLFFIKTVDPLDVRYGFDHSRKYEYDVHDLLAPCHFGGEVDWEII